MNSSVVLFLKIVVHRAETMIRDGYHQDLASLNLMLMQLIVSGMWAQVLDVLSAKTKG